MARRRSAERVIAAQHQIAAAERDDRVVAGIVFSDQCKRPQLGFKKDISRCVHLHATIGRRQTDADLPRARVGKIHAADRGISGQQAHASAAQRTRCQRAIDVHCIHAQINAARARYLHAVVIELEGRAVLAARRAQREAGRALVKDALRLRRVDLGAHRRADAVHVRRQVCHAAVQVRNARLQPRRRRLQLRDVPLGVADARGETVCSRAELGNVALGVCNLRR